jgi:prepilin-type N-terminal cleavage/methylation domain-containing protein
MGPFNTPQRRNGGYSLIEILVVLVIVGVLATAGAMMVQSPIPAAVKSGTSSLSGALRHAQTLALSSGRMVYLQPTGVGTTSPGLQWGFATLAANGAVTVDPAGPQGAWVLPPSESRFLSIGGSAALGLAVTGSGTLPKDLAAIAAHVKNTATWNTTFYATTTTPTYYFMSNGSINTEFFVIVAGARSGTVFSSGNRLGLIVVSPGSGISTYLKQNPASATPPWSRL